MPKNAPTDLINRSRRGLRLLDKVAVKGCDEKRLNFLRQQVIRKTGKRLGFDKTQIKAVEKFLLRGPRG